jgi:hypothetical protein
MNIEQAVEEIDAEIKRLTQVRELLSESSSGAPSRGKRTISPETRRNMAEAQQNRRAAAKRAGK